MPEWPDAPGVVRFLASAARRLGWLAAMRGAAIGLVLAAAIAAAAWIAGWSATGALMAGAVATAASAAGALWRERRARASTAARVERRAPACRNVLVTAAEIVRQPDRVRPYVGAQVCRDAVRAIEGLDLPALFPARRTITAVVVAGAVAASASLALIARTPVPTALIPPPFRAAALLRSVEITITPPAYSGRPPESLRDPEQITVLAGSRVDVVVHGQARHASLETTDGRAALTRTDSGSFAGAVTALHDGFLAVDARGDTEAEAARRLIGVRVTPDARPTVRITKPGQDLLLSDPARTLDLEITAGDDLGLASLRVTYTKVTGTGENFTFADGEVPLTIAREHDRAWTATARFPLAPIALAPGDMIVYRAIARDHRPGAPAAESDAFIVEMLAPGHEAADGFAIDDQTDRYAISQQMVILKTERLIARRASLSAEALAEEAHLLSAEQRQVRAEFVFMMGGHIEDEEVEAAGEEEIAAGRLENRGRLDLVRAIRAMSDAATALTDIDLTQGLADERRALASLQRAFTRSRYILRTLSDRERVDESRRLTGTATGVGRDVRPSVAAPASPHADALRHALAGSAALATRADLTAADAARSDALASAVLRLDPASSPLGSIATLLTTAAARIRANDPDRARAALGDAATQLAAALATELSRGHAASPSVTGRLIDGALADALRRSGGR